MPANCRCWPCAEICLTPNLQRNAVLDKTRDKMTVSIAGYLSVPSVAPKWPFGSLQVVWVHFFPDLVPDILHVAYNYFPVSVLLFHFAYAVVELQLNRNGKCLFLRFPGSLTSQMR
jgi:hypothetical protein